MPTRSPPPAAPLAQRQPETPLGTIWHRVKGASADSGSGNGLPLPPTAHEELAGRSPVRYN